MEAASQWNNMPSNQRLVEKKYQSDCFWIHVLYFAVECELTHSKVISTWQNVFQIQKHLHTPQNWKKSQKYKIFHIFGR